MIHIEEKDQLQKNLWKRFRKKPVVIEATQMECQFSVETKEGVFLRGKIGDWLIEGIDGELYPCDAKIFEKTYEAVES